MKTSCNIKFIVLLILVVAIHGVFDIGITKGPSMLPTLPETPSVVLIFKSPFYSPSTGDMVVARDVDNEYVVKRVKWNDGKQCFLVGDNPSQSCDSRTYGPLPISSVIGLAMPI